MKYGITRCIDVTVDEAADAVISTVAKCVVTFVDVEHLAEQRGQFL